VPAENASSASGDVPACEYGDLRFHREIADFIQEERAAVSGFKPSFHSVPEPICPIRAALLKRLASWRQSTRTPQSDITVRYPHPRGLAFLELTMHTAAIQAKARGVYCRYCGKPIWLSATFLKRETTIKQNEQTSMQEFSSRVFPARCRICHEEAIYTLSQILDFPEENSRKL